MSFNAVFLLLGMNFFWQTALIALAVFVAFKVLPKDQAKTRHTIALMGFFGALFLLIVPFTPTLLMDRFISDGASPISFIAPDTNATGVFEPLTPAPSFTPAASPSSPRPSTFAQALARFAPLLGQMALSVWAIGAVLAILRLGAAIWRSAQWVNNANPAPVEDRMALSHPVNIARSVHVGAPLVLGFFRPIILVPHDFKMSAEHSSIGAQTRAVLEHEIAHIQRGDIWVNFAQQCVLAVFWWCLPLYWVNRHINIEREKLCDDIAAAVTGAGRPLARALVNFAQANSRVPVPALAVGILHPFPPRAALLKQRIQRLNKEKTMSNVPLKTSTIVSLIIPLTIASMALITPRAVADNSNAVQIGNAALTGNVTYAADAPLARENAQLLFYQAAAYGETSMIEKFLLEGISANFAIPGDGTPLLEAARSGDAAMVTTLLEGGADPNLGIGGDGTALIAAANHGHLDVIELLLEGGAKIDLGSSGDGNPLIGAVHGNKIKAVKYLVDKGANIDAMVAGDETPLINAAQGGRLDIVKFLVEKGADVSLGMWADSYRQSDYKWRTPLSEARNNNHSAVVKYLKSKGAQHNEPAVKPTGSMFGSGKFNTDKLAGLWGKKFARKWDDKFADKWKNKYEQKYDDKYAEKYKELYEKTYARKYAEQYERVYGESFSEQYSEAFTEKFTEKFDKAFNETFALELDVSVEIDDVDVDVD